MAAIHANFSEDAREVYTESVYQHDKGVRLLINGLNLPERYGVQFSNNKDMGFSVALTGTAEGVMIPDAFLSTGEFVYAYVQKQTYEGRFTTNSIVIPIIPRPVPVFAQVDAKPDVFDYDVEVNEENLIIIDDRNRDADTTHPEENNGGE